jgi:hypothetical protein
MESNWPGFFNGTGLADEEPVPDLFSVGEETRT